MNTKITVVKKSNNEIVYSIPTNVPHTINFVNKVGETEFKSHPEICIEVDETKIYFDTRDYELSGVDSL